MSGRSQGVRLRRTWPQRMLIIFNVGCIVAALSAAGALAYAKRTTSQIDRLVISSIQSNATLDSTDPRNFLIVGNDSIEGTDEDDPSRAGRDEVEGVRSDTIMIVRVDPEDTEVKVLSLPRDLWVDIPGHDPSRINATLPLGGPDLLIQTIKAEFDIDINHYVQVDFAGFQEMVDALDGVPIWFDTPVRDNHSGLHVDTSGCTTLDRNGALAYVRSRHYEVQDADGDWVDDPQSDLSRIQRQQDFIKRLLRRAVNKGARNPVKLADFVGIGVDAIKLDQNTTLNDLIGLGNALRNFNPDTLKSYTVPVTDVTRSGAAVLDLQEGRAEPTLALFRGTGTPEQSNAISPATVEARVANGTGALNQGQDTTDRLALDGFKMGGVLGDTRVLRTEVRYPKGQQAGAVLVARYLDADVALVPDDDVEVVTVVTGPDFRSVLTTPRAPEAIELPAATTTTTSTTRPDATTTTVDADDDTPSTTGVDEDGVEVTVPSDFVPQGAPAGQDCG